MTMERGTDRIESERLVLRRITEGDLEFFARVQLVFERELGYTLDRRFWGHGYASEAAHCVFEYACSVKRLSRVISLIHPDNIRSLRVAHQFGLKLVDSVETMGHPRDRYLWPMLRTNAFGAVER